MRALIIFAGLALAACQKDGPVQDENTVIVSNDTHPDTHICYDADGRRVTCPDE